MMDKSHEALSSNGTRMSSDAKLGGSGASKGRKNSINYKQQVAPSGNRDRRHLLSLLCLTANPLRPARNVCKPDPLTLRATSSRSGSLGSAPASLMPDIPGAVVSS